MIVFCGFLALFKHMPKIMLFISDFSIHKYCLVALTIAAYDGARPDIYCPEDHLYCHYSKAPIIMKELGVDTESYYVNIFKLLGQLLLFKAVGFFTLRRALTKG
jgi:hypothetical protein